MFQVSNLQDIAHMPHGCRKRYIRQGKEVRVSLTCPDVMPRNWCANIIRQRLKALRVVRVPRAGTIRDNPNKQIKVIRI